MLKNHKKLVLAVSGLLALVLLLLAVLGTVSLVRSSRAVYSYKGQTVGTGEYAYFASVYKNSFMRECTQRGVLGVADTAFFWGRRDSELDKTYGELYLSGLDDYVRSLLVAADLFDDAVGMKQKDKKELSETLEAVLEDRADGDKSAFNTQTEQYGFTYDDFCDAALLQYKSARLVSVISSGAKDTVSTMTDICDAFFEEQYAHVKLLFIRTESVFCYDEEGNRLTDEGTGSDLTRPLRDEERLEREADIRTLADAIANFDAGKENSINSVMFDRYMEKYKNDADSDRIEEGYYFADGEPYTVQMKEKIDVIVNNSLHMDNETYRVISMESGDFIGTCIIYRMANTPGAYANSELSAMFSAFYGGAAQYYVLENITEELGFVKQGRKFGQISPLEIPRNYYYTTGF